MWVKGNYELRNVLDEYIVLPKGKEMTDFEGAIVLSPEAAFAWEQLQKDITEETLLEAILGEFEVSEEKARADLEQLLEKLEGYGVLER